MNNRRFLTGRLPGRTPLSAAIAAVTLTLAGPAALAEEHATGANDPQSQAAESRSQSDYGSQTQSFTALDQDGNGYLSESELQASDAEQANVDNLDSDNDGQVSRSEFAAMATGGMGASQSMSSSDSSSSDSSSDSSASDESWSDESSTAQSTGAQSTSDQSSMSQSDSSQSDSSQSSSSQSGSGQGQAEAVAKIGEQDESLTTFTQALEATGMADALTDQTKYTIFAPTNDAFESRSGKSAEELMKPENRQELISLLRAHIVADDVDQEMAQNISEAKTIDGGTVSLAMQDDTLQVGDAAVTGSEIQEGSLRVYPIDGVLEPQAGAQTAAASSSSSQTGSSGQQSASSQTASGQQTASQGMEFSDLDQDGDGYLSQEELQQAQGIDSPEETAQRLDTDQDGQVSRSEFAAFEQSSAESASDSDSNWDSGSQRQSDQ